MTENDVRNKIMIAFTGTTGSEFYDLFSFLMVFQW